jgi:hypothetical protein
MPNSSHPTLLVLLRSLQLSGEQTALLATEIARWLETIEPSSLERQEHQDSLLQDLHDMVATGTATAQLAGQWRHALVTVEQLQGLEGEGSADAV